MFELIFKQWKKCLFWRFYLHAGLFNITKYFLYFYLNSERFIITYTGVQTLKNKHKMLIKFTNSKFNCSRCDITMMSQIVKSVTVTMENQNVISFILLVILLSNDSYMLTPLGSHRYYYFVISQHVTL